MREVTSLQILQILKEKGILWTTFRLYIWQLRWKKFLEEHELPKLTQEKIHVCMKEVGFVIKDLPAKPSPGLGGSTIAFCRIFKVWSNSNCTQTFPKKWKGGNGYLLLLWGQCDPSTKTRQRHSRKRKQQTKIPHEYRWKILQPEKGHLQKFYSRLI